MLDHKLYEVAPEIERIIRENTDYDTGEIAPDAVERIIALEEHAELKIHNCAQVIRNDNDRIDAIDSAIKRLQADKKKIVTHRDGLEKYLINCAEQLHIDEVFVDGFTTQIKDSRESVVVDSITQLDDEFVVVSESYRADKRAILRFWKSTEIVPAGAKIVKRKIVKV